MILFLLKIKYKTNKLVKSIEWAPHLVQTQQVA